MTSYEEILGKNIGAYVFCPSQDLETLETIPVLLKCCKIQGTVFWEQKDKMGGGGYRKESRSCILT